MLAVGLRVTVERLDPQESPAPSLAPKRQSLLMPRDQWAGMIDVVVVACVADAWNNFLILPEMLSFVRVGKMAKPPCSFCPQEISIESHLSVNLKKRKNCSYLGSTVEELLFRLGNEGD